MRHRAYETADRAVDVQVSSLRRKLGDDPNEPRFIRTVRSVGYMLIGQEPGLRPSAMGLIRCVFLATAPLLVAPGLLQAAAQEPVKTESGLISGVPARDPAITVHKNIPYAPHRQSMIRTAQGCCLGVRRSRCTWHHGTW